MAKKSEDNSTKKTTGKKDSRSYLYAVGKRKSAIARVRLFQKGKGDFVVNDKKLDEYFAAGLLEKILLPLTILGVGKDYDIVAKVEGGGAVGQADALCHAIARALSLEGDDSRLTLKRAGLLTRDSRVKERKKYGKKSARRSPQWNKR